MGTVFPSFVMALIGFILTMLVLISSEKCNLNLRIGCYLKEVDVACFKLSFLNLSNCCSLEIMKLQCPRLTSLFLQPNTID
ncbi:hypothetical protein MKX01_005780 [Papaver californicum]|nr:hypothetical protein MKX01_005780 [Papaver californicum]